MRRLRCICPRSILIDIVSFLVAYVVAAYFADASHATFTNALYVHASLLLVSFVVWCLLTCPGDHTTKQQTAPFIPHLFSVLRVVFLWAALILCLSMLVKPEQLDSAELLVYQGVLIVLLGAQCLLRLNLWDLFLYRYQTLRRSMPGGRPPVSEWSPRLNAALLNENTVRGTPL